jgi:hypothetical protein
VGAAATPPLCFERPAAWQAPYLVLASILAFMDITSRRLASQARRTWWRSWPGGLPVRALGNGVLDREGSGQFEILPNPVGMRQELRGSFKMA